MNSGQDKLSLVILAAGIGRRFGGIKQLTAIGPTGETIIDYSLYDAISAGFERVVFIIRREIEDDFRRIIGQAWEKRIEVVYVFQELSSSLPEGWTIPPTRTKPWGTAHALMMTEPVIDGPFAVINADDFYGPKSFKEMFSFLTQLKTKCKEVESQQKPEYALVGYRLKNTLSAFGPVCRGICRIDGNYVVDIVEMKHIVKQERGAKATLENGTLLELSGEEVASMNFWGFDPSLFSFLRPGFAHFLASSGHDPQAEFLIPDFIGHLLRQGQMCVRYLPKEEKWFGVTYIEDVPEVREGLARLLAAGVYPPRIKDS